MRRFLPCCVVALIAALPQLSAAEPAQWQAVWAVDDGRVLAVGAGSLGLSPEQPTLTLDHQASGQAYPAAWVVRRQLRDGVWHDEAVVHVPAGGLRPTAVVANGDHVWVAGYGSQGLVEEPRISAQTPGLRLHDPSFPMRDLEVYIPPEHHDEPRVPRGRDRRGVPVVLRFNAELSELQAFATLEGWESSWFIPAQLQEVWHQPVLLTLLDDGDLMVAHDGGMNRIPEAGRQADFADYSLVDDHVSRLSPDVTQRRWRSDVSGPAIDAAAISATIGRGVHFRGTRAESWQHPTLGNPRILGMHRDRQGTGVWVVGLSSSRTDEEPWWCPFVIHIAADGAQTPGPFTPSPTAGGGRLGGQVADSGVFAVAPTADGDLYLAVISDGGNTVTRRHPLRPLEEVSGWQGMTEPFRGRTLLWGGITRLDPAFDLRWGRHIGGAGLDRRERRTQLPCWPDRLRVTEGGLLLASGRIAPGAAIMDQRAEQWSAFLLAVDPSGELLTVELLPGAQIHDLLPLATGGVLVVGRGGGQGLWQVLAQPPVEGASQE